MLQNRKPMNGLIVKNIYRQWRSVVLCSFVGGLSFLTQAHAKEGNRDRQKAVPFLKGIEVRINKRGPYLFGLDTGMGQAFILDPELAHQQALPVTGHTRMHSGIDRADDPDVPIVHANRMQLAGRTIRDAIGMPMENYSPMVKAGRGTLGMALFKNTVLYLDYGRDLLWLSRRSLPKPDGKRVLLYDDINLLPYIEVSLNGMVVKAEVDSGARDAGSDLVLPRELAAQLALVDRKESGQMVRDINGRQYSLATANLDGDLRIGTLIVSHPKVLIGAFSSHVILGGVLNRLTVGIDQKHHRIEFVPSEVLDR
jgi:hypothetical protein